MTCEIYQLVGPDKAILLFLMFASFIFGLWFGTRVLGAWIHGAVQK